MSRPDPGTLPAAPGAYALEIRLARTLKLPVAALGLPRLRPGRYVYLGSARGPGGLRARVGRHLKAGKIERWHVDHLTARAGVAAVVSRAGSSECAMVRALLAAPGVGVPVAGFGSSDCRDCPAHLLLVPEGLDLEAAL
ncbi:MAG: GIY-YIG nuclease family protein [Alphaproteobacteria bacterium]